MSIKESFSDYIKRLADEIRGIKSVEDLKYANMKIVLPAVGILILIYITYYAILFSVHSSPKKEDTPKTNTNTQAVVDFNAPMSSSINNGSAANTPKAEKIPSAFMDMDTVNKLPTETKNIYFKAFDVIYDFIESINYKQYNQAINLLDPKYVKQSNITTQDLMNYSAETFFSNNSFFLSSLEKADSSFVFKTSILDKNNPGISFYLYINVKDVDGNMKLSIDSFKKYISSVRQ